MAYFSSEYECRLDAKGRMVLPAKVKAALPEAAEHKLVITRGFEPCLTLYPYHVWMKIFEQVSQLNEFNEEYRRFQRNFLRGNTEVELDKNGRFLLPRTMMRFAKLEKEAVVVGLGNRLEVWNPELYDEYLIKDPGEFSSMASKLLGGVLTEAPEAPAAPAIQPTATDQ